MDKIDIPSLWDKIDLNVAWPSDSARHKRAQEDAKLNGIQHCSFSGNGHVISVRRTLQLWRTFASRQDKIEREKGSGLDWTASCNTMTFLQ